MRSPCPIKPSCAQALRGRRTPSLRTVLSTAPTTRTRYKRTETLLRISTTTTDLHEVLFLSGRIFQILRGRSFCGRPTLSEFSRISESKNRGCKQVEIQYLQPRFLRMWQPRRSNCCPSTLDCHEYWTARPVPERSAASDGLGRHLNAGCRKHDRQPSMGNRNGFRYRWLPVDDFGASDREDGEGIVGLATGRL